MRRALAMTRRAQGRRVSSRYDPDDFVGLPDPDYLLYPPGAPSQPGAPPTDDGRPMADTSSRKRALEDPPEPALAQKQPKTQPPEAVEPEQLQARMKYADFYYRDGNVIVIVENIEFKLHLTRLRLHCEFFRLYCRFDDEPVVQGAEPRVDAAATALSQDARLPVALSPGPPVSNVPVEEVNKASNQGALVQTTSVIIGPHVVRDGHIPEVKLNGLRIADFIEFLRALETPLMYTITPPSQAVALALLRVATPLGCTAVLDFARHRLRQLWPDVVPHEGMEVIGYDAALEVISAARQFGLPELLKQAFYEVLQSIAFWRHAETERHTLPLGDADLLMLYRARHVLQQLWSERILVPPPYPCPTGKCTRNSAADRELTWYAHIVKSGYLQKGQQDPMRHIDGLSRYAVQTLAKSWCGACLDKNIVAWATAKQEWWKKMDELFGLVRPPRV
ncbi:hypothetical protein BV20DRAFT_1057988 [Pilatotrama ljubarskyi]|nr:hypothetical protein BV20DRAFT_1057988 [Pilatotrama ljubarskyi]